jgi:hypothetical protein
LTGLAASALVIGGVWLSEMPQTNVGASVAVPVVVVAPPNSWQGVALNQSANSLPIGENDPQMQRVVADARATDWMVNSLSGKPR